MQNAWGCLSLPGRNTAPQKKAHHGQCNESNSRRLWRQLADAGWVQWNCLHGLLDQGLLCPQMHSGPCHTQPEVIAKVYTGSGKNQGWETVSLWAYHLSTYLQNAQHAPVPLGEDAKFQTSTYNLVEEAKYMEQGGPSRPISAQKWSVLCSFSQAHVGEGNTKVFPSRNQSWLPSRSNSCFTRAGVNVVSQVWWLLGINLPGWLLWLHGRSLVCLPRM